MCVRFCDQIVGCVPGYDDRDRSGDEVCAVGEAEQMCFAQGLEVFLDVREQTLAVGFEIED